MSKNKTSSEHDRLTRIALRWLKRAPSAGGPGCAIALSECRTGPNGEIPDAIGFRRTGHLALDGSILVEIKTSRADFLADFDKPHRHTGGVGSWRYYMTPKGLITIDELPDKWGLIEVNTRGHVKVLAGHVLFFRNYDEKNAQATRWRFENVDMEREQYMLVRTLANTGDPQKVLDMLRKSNNAHAQLMRRLSSIAIALGLNEESSSYEIETAAENLRREHNTVMRTIGFTSEAIIFDLQKRIQKLTDAVPDDVLEEVTEEKPPTMIGRNGQRITLPHCAQRRQKITRHDD